MKKVLLTGTSGFLGRSLCSLFAKKKDLEVHRLVRRECNISEGFQDHLVGRFDGDTNFSLDRICPDAVVHAAAKVHLQGEEWCESEIYAVNYEATVNLAQQCVEAGVKRFVFISSIGVLGNGSFSVRNEKSPWEPYNPYTRSKFLAEKELLRIADESSLEVVIIRMPLIYGPHAPGNFRSLYSLARIRVPLPFSMINNRRSMLYIDNAVDFLYLSLFSEKASNEIFCLSDGKDLSVREIIISLRAGMGRRALVYPVPKMFFSLIGRLLGKRELVEKLTGDLVVDSSKARRLLGWVPKVTPEEGLFETGRLWSEK